MSSWAKCLLETEPRVLLAGHSLEEDYGEALRSFWRNYQATDPGLPLFQEQQDCSNAIPYMVHGDEGRGKSRRPCMVLAVQPYISWRGVDFVNTCGQLG